MSDDKKVHTDPDFLIEELRERIAELERERDEVVERERVLRDALEPFAKIELPANATAGTWVARTLYCNDQVTAHSVLNARAALSSPHPATGRRAMSDASSRPAAAETPEDDKRLLTAVMLLAKGDKLTAKDIAAALRAERERGAAEMRERAAEVARDKSVWVGDYQEEIADAILALSPK